MSTFEDSCRSHQGINKVSNIVLEASPVDSKTSITPNVGPSRRNLVKANIIPRQVALGCVFGMLFDWSLKRTYKELKCSLTIDGMKLKSLCPNLVLDFEFDSPNLRTAISFIFSS